MTVWIDAQLPPALAPWLSATFGLTATSCRDLGLRDALDPAIFAVARTAGVVVISKDADFAEMVTRLGPPPQVLWLRCGNTSNAALRAILSSELPPANPAISAPVRPARPAQIT